MKKGVNTQKNIFWFKIRQEILTASELSKHFGWMMKIYCSNFLIEAQNSRQELICHGCLKGKIWTKNLNSSGHSGVPCSEDMREKDGCCVEKNQALGHGHWENSQESQLLGSVKVLNPELSSTMIDQSGVFRNKTSSRSGAWGRLVE